MTAPWDFHVLHAPLDFANILGYRNQSNPEWTSQIPRCYGDTHIAERHVSLFVDYISDLNIVHEDVGIRMCAMSLRG